MTTINKSSIRWWILQTKGLIIIITSMITYTIITIYTTLIIINGMQDQSRRMETTTELQTGPRGALGRKETSQPMWECKPQGLWIKLVLSRKVTLMMKTKVMRAQITTSKITDPKRWSKKMPKVILLWKIIFLRNKRSIEVLQTSWPPDQTINTYMVHHGTETLT